jgi:hypothetical protein
MTRRVIAPGSLGKTLAFTVFAAPHHHGRPLIPTIRSCIRQGRDLNDASRARKRVISPGH